MIVSMTGFGDATAERDGTHYSSNWDNAQRRLTIDASMLVGSLEIERID